jgi:hypothetical protein
MDERPFLINIIHRITPSTMRNCSIALILFTMMFSCSVSAQELAIGHRGRILKKALTRDLEEVFQVTDQDKNIRDGAYQVVGNEKKVLVKGAYTNGKRTGVWSYYNPQGELLQQYDYDKAAVVFAASDTTGIVHFQSQVLEPADDSDKVEPPQKIGGANYGFYLLYDSRDIPAEVKAVNDGTMTYRLTISEKGKLEGYSVIFTGKSLEPITEMKSLRGIPEDATEFIPASVNGKPVRSAMIYVVSLNISHQQIMGTNNIVTQHPEQ